jgi:hypothetical protein
MKVADHPSTKPNPSAITDVITEEVITVCLNSYTDDFIFKHAAGRTVVAINITDEDYPDASSSIDLTVEDSMRLALELINGACHAMNLDPRPYLINAADWYAVEAAQSARKYHRANELSE